MLKILKGMVAGAIVGVAVSAVMLPQLDRRTQRNLKRVEEVLTKIVRKASPEKLEKLRNNQL